MPARYTALRALVACRTAKAWSDAVLNDYIHQASLSPRDAGLASTLCYGVLQNQALLDHFIDQFLTGRKRLQPMLRDILRIAVYQILFLDRIPDSAAVNEAVKQAKKQFSQRESGLVNGLLRNLIRNKDDLAAPKDYSILYSHPAELVDLIKDSVGKNLRAVLEADNTSPETSVVTNTLKTTPQELKGSLEASGVEVQEHPWLSGCFLLKGTGNLINLPAFSQGLMQIQDAAARLAVDIINPLPGMNVLDLCAAPGGKSMAAAMHMNNCGTITSCDLHGGKLSQIENTAQRLGIDIISTRENDSSVFCSEFENRFDVVIADVPCSGLGVIRKKPDIRYKDVCEMAQLPALQRQILEQGAKYIKTGGKLLYSTCTILKRENQDVVNGFLQDHSEFSLETLSLPAGVTAQENGMLTLYQGIDHCDGFFLCLMRKNR